MTYEEADKMLESYGWTLECWSPFEIGHVDGSRATGQAAQHILDAIEERETRRFNRKRRAQRKKLKKKT